MKKDPRYPTKHLSIRVPWHDNAWNGTVCNNPKSNGACLILKTCAQKKDDAKEQAMANTSLKDLDQQDFPPCITERGTVMADFKISRQITHPYVASSPSTHGHLKPTTITYPSFAAASIPYFWMRKENAIGKAEEFDLDYDQAREPEMEWQKSDEVGWVQEYGNQKALLNCFFQHLEEETSLVFLYAKQAPFVEVGGRVLMGVGRVKKIIPSEKYDGSNSRFAAAYWEHMVLHSVRSDCKDGFLIPYHDALKYQEQHSDFDISSIVVMAPSDKQFEFSYVSEHVSSDTAIRVLLDCIKSWETAKENGIGNYHNKAIQWIHDQVAELQKLRGEYPGMGSALCALGIERGHFVAAEIINTKKEADNPWTLFEKALTNPKGVLSSEIASLIPATSKAVYQKLKKENSPRIKFLHLLSRFDLTIHQATILYNSVDIKVDDYNTTKNFRSDYTDENFLENPYLIFEAAIHSQVPIALSTIDLGLYLKNAPTHLLPGGYHYTDALTPNRIRALTIQQLEIASGAGHTLLPRKELIKQIRNLSLEPACQVSKDYYELAESVFTGAIEKDQMKNEDIAYQLTRLAKCSETIRTKISERISGKAKRNIVTANWRKLVDQKFGASDPSDPQEEKARVEKSKALEEIAAARFSVLIGPAGTGKTTLLTILASHPEVQKNGVLLLAPTGKARVRMEEIAAGLPVTALTLAQFLNGYDRYDGSVQRYIFSKKCCEGTYKTVILDEASMLTEEMLATTLDCLKQVSRIILVGDHRQLPPIGSGRPFVDVKKYLTPENRDSIFPKVANGYAELTIKRRQGGSDREDIQLAEWFGGEALEPGADQVINDILTGKKSKYLRMVQWDDENDFEKKFEQVIIEELNLSSMNDEKSFNISIGSVDGTWFNFKQAVNKVEAWQILSPVKEKVYGVRAINRILHKSFRVEALKWARDRYGKTPAPVGLEEIVYGDKVINVRNQSRWKKTVWPEGGLNYVANGEIGITVGLFKPPGWKGKPDRIEVEFTSQKGYKYSFKKGEFSDEGDSTLELAYALTVHKAQGSEFGVVFLIVPNPCFLLTREMLYTALTRQKNRVVVLYQGSVFDIKELSSPLKSDTLRRITNLFIKPDLLEIDDHFLEKNLIHEASDGTMLRSKSELLIYQQLLSKGLTPVYEKKLSINEVEKTPDFTIEIDETGEVFYWEHCGLMFDVNYEKRWKEKLKWYRENHILPFGESDEKQVATLIISEDHPAQVEDGSTKGAISVKEIDSIIKKVFDRG